MATTNDNLILLEFLVDNVILEYSVQQSLKCMAGDTCVAFQFLDNAPIFVCEEDFLPKKKNYTDGCGGCSSLKNGKSCLFALNPKQAEQCLKQFDVYVEVFRKMKAGMLPEKLTLGESLISIANLFKELVSAANAAENNEPTAKTLKDCFKIQNTAGELVGRIGVYIRMSSFGKLIVTQFQMNLQNKNVEFKAKEGHYLFKTNTNKASGKPCREPLSQMNVLNYRCGVPPPCTEAQRPCASEPGACGPPIPCPAAASNYDERMPASDNSHSDQPCTASPPCPPPSACCPPPPPACCMAPQPPCGPPPPCPMCGQCTPPACPACGQCPPPPPVCPPPPCPPPPDPCQMYQMRQQQPQFETPCYECSGESPYAQVPPPPADTDYQEFGAEMGGNSLIIRVHKNRKVEDAKDGEQCCCEPGNGAGRGKPAIYQCPPPTTDCCCAPPQQQAAGQQAIRAPPAASDAPCVTCCPDPNAPFTFKMGGATQVTNNVSLVSPNVTQKKCPKMGDIQQPDKEVFILRIGKKNESASTKNNMEIELCTPKGKEFKKPVRKEEREQQCDPAEDKVEKVKKVKQKKGGGGKKGKKGKKK